MKKIRGFTLIELMVVVIVIAILAAIAIPSYLNQTRKARRNAAKDILQQVALLEERYRADNSGYLAAPSSASTNWRSLGAYPGSTYYDFAVTVAAATSVAPATFSIVATAKSAQVKDASCTTLTYAVDPTTGAITKTPPGCW